MADRIITDSDGELLVGGRLVDKLDGLLTTLGRIEKSIDGKADKSDLVHMDERVGKLEAWRHEKEVASAITHATDERVFTRREKRWGALVGFLSLAALWAGIAVTLVVH